MIAFQLAVLLASVYAQDADEFIVYPLSGGPGTPEIIEPIEQTPRFDDYTNEEGKHKIPVLVESGSPTQVDFLDRPWKPLDNCYTRFATDGKHVDVYVIDTGARIGHRELYRRVPDRVNFVEGEHDTFDGANHGTAVASAISGSYIGVVRKANVIIVKVMNAEGRGTMEWVNKGLQWTLDRIKRTGCPSVVNMSFGARGRNTNMENLLNQLSDAGAILVASAGNDGIDACGQMPAYHPDVITVGGYNHYDNTPLPFSNRGPCVDIWAPGLAEKAASRYSKTTYSRDVGTSMAAPLVSGIAAALLGEGYSPHEVDHMIRHDGCRKSSISHAFPDTTDRIAYSLLGVVY